MSTQIMSSHGFPDEIFLKNNQLSRSQSHPVQVDPSIFKSDHNFTYSTSSYSTIGENNHRKLSRRHSDSEDKQASPQQRNVNSSRYKTELCRPYEENGHCKYGDKCQFAHGAHELRSLVRHPKYKTEMCRTFHTIGLCPYGPRCHFVHGDRDEVRPQKQQMTQQQSSRPRPLSLSSSSSPTSSLSESPTSMMAFFSDDDPSVMFNPHSYLNQVNQTSQQMQHYQAKPKLQTYLDSPPSPVNSLSSDLDLLRISPGPLDSTNNSLYDIALMNNVRNNPLRLPVFSRLSVE